MTAFTLGVALIYAALRVIGAAVRIIFWTAALLLKIAVYILVGRA